MSRTADSRERGRFFVAAAVMGCQPVPPAAWLCPCLFLLVSSSVCFLFASLSLSPFSLLPSVILSDCRLFVCIYLSVCLYASVYLSICLYASMSICLCLYVCLCLYICLCLYACLSLCLYDGPNFYICSSVISPHFICWYKCVCEALIKIRWLLPLHTSESSRSSNEAPAPGIPLM